MKQLWLDEASKFQFWLIVEVAIIRARAAKSARAKRLLPLLDNVSINVQRIDELEEETHHDRISFQMMIQEQVVKLQEEEKTDPDEPSLAGEFGYGTTSYDVEDPALILMLREAAGLILGELRRLIAALEKRAQEHKWTLCIAETHGQDAQPSTFGHLLLVYASEVRRCVRRLERVLSDDLSEGRISGAVGTYSVLSPEIEEAALADLGLVPAVVETQVLQRDRHASLIANLAITARAISQIARTFHTKMRSKYKELREPRVPGQKGSSAMAHKRNPHVTESLLGLARKVSALVAPALENIELMDWRDISHSSVERDILPEATGYVHYMAAKLSWIVEELEIFPDAMLENLSETHGVWASEKVRALLLEKGVIPELAYRHIQKAAFAADDTKQPLESILRSTLIQDSFDTVPDLIGDEVMKECFDTRASIEVGNQAIYNKYRNAFAA